MKRSKIPAWRRLAEPDLLPSIGTLHQDQPGPRCSSKGAPMAANISASPKLVVFTYPDVVFHRQLDVSISWNTGDPKVTGRVFRSLNGGAETPLAGAARVSGTAAEKISLDQVLTFVLRKAKGGQELSRTTVTTQKNALAAHMTDPDLGFIFSLKLDVGADSLGVAFQTKQPAVPWVEIRRQDTGELVDLSMSGGFRQQHQLLFNGFHGGLPQETAFNVRIAALKDIGGGRVRLGSSSYNPEVRGVVITGSRSVTFHFGNVYVRNDGDPAGAGEFTFWFGVGDVRTQQLLGPVEEWKGDIPARYSRDVNKFITIDHAPRTMWYQVVAWEDDTSFGDLLGHPGGLGFAQPTGPGYLPPGTDGREVDEGCIAWVTHHFDTNEAPDRNRPFGMQTGNFAIAYDVFGETTVTLRKGINKFRGVPLGRVMTTRKMSARALVHSMVLQAGRTRTIRRGRDLLTVSLGPDGNVLVRAADPRTGIGSMADLGGRFDASVTLVASPHDTVHILGLSPSGEVVARTLAPPECATDDGWTHLGGAFTGAVTAVDRDCGVDVMARDAEGRVFHRTLPIGGSQGDWTRIGQCVAGPVAASGTLAGDLAVFGLGSDGRILHKRLTADGEWITESGDWDVLGRVDGPTAAEGTISVHWPTDHDLIVSVFVGDDLAGALLWRCYPEPDRDAGWVAVLGVLETQGALGSMISDAAVPIKVSVHPRVEPVQLDPM
jgi:hypothetical protein